MVFRKKPEKFRGPLTSFEERERAIQNSKLLERLRVMEKTYSGMLADHGKIFAKSKGGAELAGQIAAVRARLGIKHPKPIKPID